MNYQKTLAREKAIWEDLGLDLKGFTVIEAAAGCSLSEIFDIYASTSREIEYAEYLSYAGLSIDVNPRELPRNFFGAVTRQQGDSLVISSLIWDSPAWHGGLSARDGILMVDGREGSSRLLEEILSTKKPGDKLQVLVSRRGRELECEVVLEPNMGRSFKIEPIQNPNPMQSKILEDWLGVNPFN